MAFLENQKDNLKNMECDSLEEIGRKLELFHGYEDQIAAARAEYNYSQMFCVMDEAKERGEQIAEAAEKYAPKTPEERREELVEEALGADENKGELTESMEALLELTEELDEALTEELAEKAVEELTEGAAEALTELAEDLPTEEMAPEAAPEAAVGLEAAALSSDTEKAGALDKVYRSVDIRI